MENQKLSLTYKCFNKLGIINDSHKYGSISLWGIVAHTVFVIKTAVYFKVAYKPGIFETYKYKHIRARLWRKMGCHVGKNVNIGHTVAVDYGNTDLVHIEDKVIITHGCILLCHRRDMSRYRKYDDSYELPYIYKPITLKTGCQIGMGSIIMPGVTIGEGAIIGALSVVTRDIPAWTIAVGNPCKVIKDIEEGNDN